MCILPLSIVVQREGREEGGRTGRKEGGQLMGDSHRKI